MNPSIKKNLNDTLSLRKSLSYFPTGVAIATTYNKNKIPVGLTISSFNSVSLNPPLILWCIDHNNGNLEDFREKKLFSINILSNKQLKICKHFSDQNNNRFENIKWYKSKLGLPIIENVVAVFECEVFACYSGGDHEIIVGKVINHYHEDKIPLVYGIGKFTSLKTQSDLNDS